MVHVEGVTRLGGADDDMDIEDAHDTRHESMDDVVVVGNEELENIIDEQDRAEVIENLVPAEASEASEYIWPDVSPNHVVKYQHEVDEVRGRFDAEDEEYDATMCSEYAEEIFQYMSNLEVRFLPFLLAASLYLDCKRMPSCLRQITWTHRTRSPGACVKHSLIGFCRSISAIICSQRRYGSLSTLSTASCLIVRCPWSNFSSLASPPCS